MLFVLIGVGAGDQVFFNIQFVENPAAFHDLKYTHADDLFGVHPVDALAHKGDAAVGDGPVLGFQQAGDGLEGGGLPGPVAPQDGHDLTFPDLQGEPLQAPG